MLHRLRDSLTSKRLATLVAFFLLTTPIFSQGPTLEDLVRDPDTVRELWELSQDQDQVLELYQQAIDRLIEFRQQFKKELEGLSAIALEEKLRDGGLSLKEIDSIMDKLEEGEFEQALIKRVLLAVERDHIFVQGEQSQSHLKSEINTIDNNFFVRVADYDTNTVHLFIDQAHYDPESPHFKQYLARQLLRRPVKLVVQAHGKAVEEKYIPRPETYRDWWRRYGEAILVKPDKGDYLSGILFGGIVQTELVVAAGVMANYLGLESLGPEIGIMAGISLVYGTTRGIFGSTFRNWERLGPEWRQVMKRSGFGASAKYLYFALVYASVTDATLFETFFVGLPAAYLHMVIITNTIFSNWVRTKWFKIPDILSALRLDHGKVTMFGVKVKMAQLLYQLVYLPSFIASKADLMFQNTVHVLGAEVPAGRVGMLGTALVAMTITYFLPRIIRRRLVQVNQRSPTKLTENRIRHIDTFIRQEKSRPTLLKRLWRLLIKPEPHADGVPQEYRPTRQEITCQQTFMRL